MEAAAWIIVSRRRLAVLNVADNGRARDSPSSMLPLLFSLLFRGSTSQRGACSR